MILPIFSSAQEKWTLEKCVLHSQKASIAINQSEVAVSQADVSLDLAKQARYPNLNANTGVNWNFGKTVDPTSNDFITATFFSNNYGLNTGFSIFEGFRIGNNIKQAKVEKDASEADLDNMRRAIALQVATNFLNVLFAIENITISEGQLDLSQQQLDQINKSISAGALPESESLNLEAQIAQSEQVLITSRNNLDIATLQLKQVLRLDPSFPLEIEAPEDIVIQTDPDLIDFEYAFIEAQKNRPDLLANELRIQSAAIGVDIAKGLHFPSVRFGASLGSAYSNQARSFVESGTSTVQTDLLISSNNPVLPLNDVPVTISQEVPAFDISKTNYTTQIDENLSYGFGVGVSIPIYNNGNTKSNVQFAKLNAINAQLNYDQQLENLKITVQQALADARASKQKLEASEKALEAQKLAFENTTKRLEIGATNSFEWESQKTQMENAEITRLIDKYQYLFNIKILEFYLGKPLKL